MEIRNFEELLKLIEFMVAVKILEFVDNGKKVKVIDEKAVQFCCFLIWPVVETYWATLVYLFTLME